MIHINPEFAKQVHRTAVVPNGSNREEYLRFINKLNDCCKEMSTIDIRDRFDELATKHGEVVTALVVAATLLARHDSIGGWRGEWAEDMCQAWVMLRDRADALAIRDNLNPTRICEYASEFIRKHSKDIDEDFFRSMQIVRMNEQTVKTR